MKRATILIALVSTVAVAGCNGEPRATKAEEDAFKHPNRDLPSGFTVAPTTSVPPPPTTAGAGSAKTGG